MTCYITVIKMKPISVIISSTDKRRKMCFKLLLWSCLSVLLPLSFLSRHKNLLMSHALKYDPVL